MLSDQARGSLRVAMAATIWGAAYPLTKLVLNEIPPIFLGFLRFSAAAMVFVLLTRSRPLGGVAKEDRRIFIRLAFWGVFVLIIGMNFGLIWAPGIAASVLSGTPPLFTVILAAIFLDEKMQGRHFVSIALALAGLYLMSKDFSNAESTHESWKIVFGCLLTLVPQFAWAMYGITGKKLSSRYDWPVICRDTFAIGALMLLVPALAEVHAVGSGNWSISSFAILVYLALMNSVVTYSLWNSALKLIPVSTASFLIYLQPVSGAVLSYFLFGERIGLSGFAGIALIFIALFMIIKNPRSNVLPRTTI